MIRLKKQRAISIKNLKSLLIRFSTLRINTIQLAVLKQIYIDSHDQFHPNVLADKCLETITELNKVMEKAIKQIDKSVGNSTKVKFHYSDYVQQAPKYNSIQGQYQRKNTKSYDDTIIAFDFSFQDKLLACCANYFVAVYDLKLQRNISQIFPKRNITAIKYTQDEKYNYIIGDIDGYVYQYNSYSKQPLFEHRLHNLTICQILIKDECSIFTCSLDNTIKLTNIQYFQTQMVINQNFSCFCGFDYSYTEDLIIAPKNSTHISIWDCKTEKEIISQNHGFQESSFISVQLSSDSNQVLVNLYDQYTILLFDIKLKDKELVLIKQMKLHNQYEKCLNLQWCLDNTSFIYYHTGAYEIRNLKYKNIPLTFREYTKQGSTFQFERGFVNKLNKELKYLVAIYDREVQVYERKIQVNCTE